MFLEERQHFQFEWSHVGNIDQGRPNLGPTTNVVVYRLMQYTLRDALIKHTDVATADRVFFDAGHNAGSAFLENIIQPAADFNELVSKLQNTLRDLNIGIIRFEKTDLENLHFILTVDEDLDCSGLPVINEAICTYDEGFIAGIFEAFTGKAFTVKEIDCWCTGERTCRFEVKPS